MGVDYLESAYFQAKKAQKHNSGESTVKDLRVANGMRFSRPPMNQRLARWEELPEYPEPSRER
jgi:hypothetical protein